MSSLPSQKKSSSKSVARKPRSVLDDLQDQRSRRQLGGSVTFSVLVHGGLLLALAWITHLAGLPLPMITINSAIEGPDDSSMASPELKILGDDLESVSNPTESEVSLLPKVAAPDAFEMLAGSAGTGSLTAGGGGGGSGGIGQGGFFGVPLEEDSIVFVLDRSGSMKGDRIARVQYELKSAVNGLSPRQKFNVLMYNSDVAHALPASRTELLPASPTNRDRAVAATMDLSAYGGTNGVKAIQEALKLRPEAIVFLTDGEFDINVEEDVFKKNGQGTIIHTVSIGDGTSLETLRTIAGGSRGRFQHVFVKKQQNANPQAVAIANKDADRLLRMAKGLEQRRKYEKSREYCQKILQQYPNLAVAQEAKKVLSRVNKAMTDRLVRQLGEN